MRALLASVIAAAALSGCGSKCGPGSGTVVNVVDGDTIELESGVKIRYLLVDAPEITNGHNDCYGIEAADENRRLVDGKTVQLTYDDAECTDKYGRTLAYVSVDGVDVNKDLAQGGFACLLYLPPAGESRHTEFDGYVSEAQTNRAGLWGACGTIPGCGN